MSRLSPDEVCAPCSSRRGNSWRGNTRSASDMRFHIRRWWPLFGTRRPEAATKSLSKTHTGQRHRSTFNRSTTCTGPAERKSQQLDNAKPDALVAPADPQVKQSAVFGRGGALGSRGRRRRPPPLLRPAHGERPDPSARPLRRGSAPTKARPAPRGGAGREWWGKTIRDISRERARALHTQSAHSPAQLREIRGNLFAQLCRSASPAAGDWPEDRRARPLRGEPGAREGCRADAVFTPPPVPERRPPTQQSRLA
jgi:hypothetical protein